MILIAPSGTRVDVSEELAEKLAAQGWKAEASEVRRKPSRPKKSE